MRLGYSFWGFLGDGIIDTPDGGRSHRWNLLKALARHAQILLLQRDRDFHEARDTRFRHLYATDALPALDVLLLEWRWRIKGRNDTPCGAPSHSCDLHRQRTLLEEYTHKEGILTLVWDKDLRLDPRSRLRRLSNVVILEATPFPSRGARSLLFPVADDQLDELIERGPATTNKLRQLAYVGNQYDREEQFLKYFLPASTELSHVIAGKWDPDLTSGLNYAGRVAFGHGQRLLRESVATVLLAPGRYVRAGQYTQRLQEAVLAGCLPMTPVELTRRWSATPS